MKKYTITMYRACILHKEIQAETPEGALRRFKAGLSFAPTLEDAVDSIEIDEDFNPTRISVSLSEPESDKDFNLLVKDIPDVQTLKHLLSVPQTEEEYTRLVKLQRGLSEENDPSLSMLKAFVSFLINTYTQK